MILLHLRSKTFKKIIFKQNDSHYFVAKA